MIDCHCHILPGIDDGAPDVEVSVAMARAFVADGVVAVACTPHILPGVYHNRGPDIRSAVVRLQDELDRRDVPLTLVCGSDAHVTPDMIAKLGSGEILSLHDSRYVLVEPPHHVAPARLDDFFFSLMAAGYVPILTHPERLSWIEQNYALVEMLSDRGVWMQITSGSLAGVFGSRPRYWAERMLDEGRVHILATDAHEMRRRRPDLARGRDIAARRVGDDEAIHMVDTRPRGIMSNQLAAKQPPPAGALVNGADDDEIESGLHHAHRQASGAGDRGGGVAGRLRRFFGA